MKAAIYARVSTLDQEPENQLQELRRYVEARSWPPAVEYVDKGVSGSKDRRPALDRLGRNLRHLVTLLDELHAVGVSFVSLGAGSTAPRQPGDCSSTCSPPWLNSKGAASLNVSRLGWPEPGAMARAWDGPRNTSLSASWPPSGVCRSGRQRSDSGCPVPQPIGGCLRKPPGLSPSQPSELLRNWAPQGALFLSQETGV